MCLCTSVWADSGAWVRGIHLLGTVSVRGELTLMGANWMETASVHSEASSLWLKSFWSSLLGSLSLRLSGCLSTSLLSLFHRTIADERSPLWHMTHTFLSFEFFHLTDPQHPPPPPLPTNSHTCVHTHSTHFWVSCSSSLSPWQIKAVEKLLLRQWKWF